MTDAVGNVQRVLLLGGTSQIGLAVVRALAGRRSVHVLLAGRPSERLDAAATGLRADGHGAEVIAFDAEHMTGHPAVVAHAFARGDVDVAVVAVGLLGDQDAAWQDHAAAVRLAQVNYTSTVSVGVELARRFAEQGHGSVIALSSVAGERPRRSNFVYGSTKSGMDAFYTGLREALRPSGVRVLVVRPGFVHTRMTHGLSPAPLSVGPDDVATAVAQAWRSGRSVVYVPAALRPVMSLLRHLPAAVFRRLPA